jgi:aldose 1-epimerase
LRLLSTGIWGAQFAFALSPTEVPAVSSDVTLQCGDLRCEIKPALGGCIAGLWLGQTPVLRSTHAAELHSVRQSGSYPLVPFSNRIAQASLLWQGTSHPLVCNFEPEPHAIHGIGWERPWEVLDKSDTYALLSFEHRGDASWPFHFDASQALRLSAGALEMSLCITNQSSEPAPVGLGWHPSFVKRVASHLTLSTAGRWETGADKLPTHRVPDAGLDCACAVLAVDHCFDGWRGDVHLIDATLHVRVSSSLGCLVVYTDAQRDTVAIEPVSHVSNGLTLLAQSIASAQALGLKTLQPGETFTGEMRIDVERTP